MLLRRSRFARIVSRTLIAALVLGLLPVHAEASRSLIPQAPPSNLPQAPSHLAAVVVSVDGVPCAVVIYAEDPSDRIKYHRARWMEPGSGRFASTDRSRGALPDPRTLHAYTYAASSPQDHRDPTGFFFESVGVAATFSIVQSMASLSGSLLRVLATAASSTLISLVPVYVVGPAEAPVPYAGWAPDEFAAAVAGAGGIWGPAIGVQFAMAPPRQLETATNLDVGDYRTGSNAGVEKSMRDILQEVGLAWGTWSSREIPVILARNIYSEGFTKAGIAWVTNNPMAHPGALALSKFRSGPLMLAHELGHAFGIFRNSQAGLMSLGWEGGVAGGTGLTSEEIKTAKDTLARRLAGK